MGGPIVIPAGELDQKRIRTGTVTRCTRVGAAYDAYMGRQRYIMEFSDGGVGMLWWRLKDGQPPAVGTPCSYRLLLDKRGGIKVKLENITK